VTKDTVFAGNVDTVVALDKSTGRIKWNLQVNLHSGGLLSDSDRFYTASNGSIVALNATDGSASWRFEPDSAATSLCMDQTALYAVAADGDLYVLNLKDGSQMRELSLHNTDLGEAPCIISGSVGYFEGTSTLYAIDVRSGQLIWKDGPDQYDHVTLFNDVLYVNTYYDYSSESEKVYALSSINGSTLWTWTYTPTPDSSQAYGAISILPLTGRLLFSDSYDNVTALNLSSGASLWTFQANSSVVFSFHGYGALLDSWI
jgi:outer membrane protein assembly factor BamB